LALTVVTVLVAGVISLVNADLGHNVARIALLGVAVYLTNAVVWSLLQSAVVAKLPTKPKRK
jgi:drug/metabolite transporter (DMT)-like permease